MARARSTAITVHRTCPDPRLRLFCVPFAGAGSSAFRLWPDHFPHDVEVVSLQPPGRERRISEPLSLSLLDVVRSLVSDATHLLDVPFAFFGHSMGALIAFEATRELRRRNLPGPAHLVVSGLRAPRIARRTPDLHRLPDDELVAELRRLGGTPPEAFAEPELLALTLPVLRADLAACETYEYVPEALLACPLSAWAGRTDRDVDDSELEAWGQETTGQATFRRFDGGHLYTVSAVHDVTDALVQTLAPYPGTAP